MIELLIFFDISAISVLYLLMNNIDYNIKVSL